MKYLKKYDIFIFENKEEKIEKKIRKFFNVDNIIKKVLDLNPKLSIWIINEFKNLFIDAHSFDKKEVLKYFKTGKSDNDELKKEVVSFWNTKSSEFQYILDWVNSFDITPEERKNFTQLSFEQAYQKSKKWHESLKAGGVIEDEHGTVIMTFPDGFYWIDLETTLDRDEADAMGHCGSTNKGTTLYSLRDRNKSPHVTASLDEVEGIIYQMKGRNNTKPISKYHKYIVALLINDDLEYPIKGFGAEYNKSEDFCPSDLNQELHDKLIEKRPDINQVAFTDEEIENMFDQMIENDYTSDNEYGFHLVEWVKNLYDFDKVVECIDKRSDKLLDILIGEYPNKVDIDDDEDKKLELMLDIASSHINSDDVAEEFGITFSNPKDSETNKWREISNKLSYNEIEKILKRDFISWEKFEKEWEQGHGVEHFKSIFRNSYYSFGSRMVEYDYNSVIEYFFESKEESWKEFEKLFKFDYKKDKDGVYKPIDNYHSLVFDCWERYDLSMEISSKLTIKEKEDELANHGYWAYEDYG